MRLPRWLVAILLALTIGVLLGAAGWWAYAPTVTMKRFVSLVADGKLEEANTMLDNAHWMRAPEYIAFEADNRICAFPPDYWPRSVSASNIEYYVSTWGDWLRARRQFGASEKVYQVTLKFEVGPRKVRFRELYLYQKPELASVYKEHGHYGFTAKVTAVDPLSVQCSYSFGDPDGGFAVLKVNGEEQDRQPVWFGVGSCELRYRGALGENGDCRVALVDREGNVRNENKRSIIPSGTLGQR